MKTFGALFFAAGLLLGAADHAAAQAAGSGEGFNAFRVVRTRAIFDPERRSTRRESAAPTPQNTPRSNFIALTGTMVSEGKRLAFFTGSRTEYSKVIPEGESVADFKLTSIGAAQVELSLAGKAISVAVGQHLPLAGSSVPATSTDAIAAPPGDAAPTPTTTAAPVSTATAPDTNAPPAPAGDKGEVLRRMMERRQKELSK